MISNTTIIIVFVVSISYSACRRLQSFAVLIPGQQLLQLGARTYVRIVENLNRVVLSIFNDYLPAHRHHHRRRHRHSPSSSSYFTLKLLIRRHNGSSRQRAITN